MKKYLIIKSTCMYASNIQSRHDQDRYLQRHDLPVNHKDYLEDYADPGNCIVEFDTKELAQKIVDQLDGVVYYLRHGEAGRPSYEVIDSNNLPAYDLSLEGLYSPEGYKQIKKPSQELVELFDEISADFDFSCSSYDVYTATLEHEERNYMVTYCISSLCEDPSYEVDWDSPAYWIEN